VGQSVRFLYEGTNPLQKNVAPGAIDVLRSAVIRGRVLDKANSPLAGVKISAIDNPQYGSTESRANG
jgi:protocatechuate 3,4-dioxygenase beta subunit